MPNMKKYIIALIIVTLIVVMIIWYRNFQKNKEIADAKTKLVSGTTPLPISVIGKTVLVKGLTADLLTIPTLLVAYTKTGVGTFVGNIVAEKTDTGNTSFYKVINTTGQFYYVLKTSVKFL